MNTQTSALRDKVVRPCSKHRKTTSKTSKMCSHIPSVRCHEEIMSKLSPFCSTENCVGEPFSCTDKSPYNNTEKSKGKKKKSNKQRPVTFKSENIYESASVPMNAREKGSFPKTVISKSTPTVQNHNLEDSVDFIPVKLLSNNDCKDKSKNSLKQNHNLKTALKDKSLCRATWGKLLKSEGQLSSQSNKSKDKLSISERNSANNLQTDESLPSTPKKKVSINVSSRNCEQGEVYADCLYKLPDSLQNDKPPFHPFYVADPIKTLDFLIKQLREKLLNQPENDNLQKIILDMENALLKISVVKQDDLKTIQGINTFNKAESSSHIAPKSVLSDGSDSKSKNGHLDIIQLQKGLEESCLFLQSLCIRQRESCHDHLREKDQLTIQLAESRRLLAIAKSREKDYEVRIGELRLKIQELNLRQDQPSQSIKELTDIIAKLKAENEVVGSLKEAVTKLNERLKESASDKENLQYKLYLKELEIEKLKVLLEIKDNLCPVQRHIENEKFEDKIEEEVPVEDRVTSSMTLSSASSWAERPGLACSSQASGSPGHSPSPYSSWQHISAIGRQPPAAAAINKHIAHVFLDLRRGEPDDLPPLELDLPSCESSWSDRGEPYTYSESAAQSS